VVPSSSTVIRLVPAAESAGLAAGGVAEATIWGRGSSPASTGALLVPGLHAGRAGDVDPLVLGEHVGRTICPKMALLR